MIPIMTTGKRPYTKPTIVRVELNQEQAVLAACSTTTSNLRNSVGLYCRPNNCRRNNSSIGRDSAAGS